MKLNPLWSRAEQQVTGWQSISLRIPDSPDAPAVFTIDRSAGGHPDGRSQLTLNTSTGAVVRWETFAGYNAGRRLRGWARFVHTGEAGGPAGQTVAGIASLGGAVLVWTGISLAVRRLFSARARSARKPILTASQ